LKTTSIEDKLKNLKMDFLSKHWADIYQFVNVTSGDKKEEEKRLKLKTTSME
jgi:hypothetical protein